MRNRNGALLTLSFLLLAGSAWAQTSSSYRLDEHVFNNGGHPTDGTVLTSASFQIRLDSIGDGLLSQAMFSASYGLDTGFLPAYVPPGEVTGLIATDGQTFAWLPDPSVGAYNLYRGGLGSLPGSSGACHQPGLGTPTAAEAADPGAGVTWFYLVTAVNRIGDGGTTGSGRPAGACP